MKEVVIDGKTYVPKDTIKGVFSVNDFVLVNPCNVVMIVKAPLDDEIDLRISDTSLLHMKRSCNGSDCTTKLGVNYVRTPHNTKISTEFIDWGRRIEKIFSEAKSLMPYDEIRVYEMYEGAFKKDNPVLFVFSYLAVLIAPRVTNDE